MEQRPTVKIEAPADSYGRPPHAWDSTCGRRSRAALGKGRRRAPGPWRLPAWAAPRRCRLRYPRRCRRPLPTGEALRPGLTAGTPQRCASQKATACLLHGLCGAQLSLPELVTRAPVDVLPPLRTHPNHTRILSSFRSVILFASLAARTGGARS